MNLSILTAAYNEEKILPVFINHYSALAESLLAKGIINNYQICIVDDGSRDNTWKIIEDFHEKNSKLGGIRLDKNYGLHTAGATLIEWLEPPDLVLFLEVDNLLSEEDLINLLESMGKNNFDTIWVQIKERDKFRHLLSGIIFNILSFFYRTKIPPNISGMLITGEIFEKLKREKIFFINYSIAKISHNSAVYQVKPVNIRRDKSRFTLIKKLKLFFSITFCNIAPFLCKKNVKIVKERMCKNA